MTITPTRSREEGSCREKKKIGQEEKCEGNGTEGAAMTATTTNKDSRIPVEETVGNNSVR